MPLAYERDGRRSQRWRLTLAGRATVYVLALVAAMAVVCGMTVLGAFRADTAQNAKKHAFMLSGVVERVMAQRIEDGDLDGLDRAVRQMSMPSFIDHASIYDGEGRRLAAAGAAATPMQGRALRAGRESEQGGSVVTDDMVWTAAPLRSTDGAVAGWLSLGVSRSQMMQENLPALAPFFLFFIAFTGIAAGLTVIAVRRRAQPLHDLARFAERISKEGLGQRIELKTGDEFEQLATSFNGMIGKLEASMQRIQRLAYVDPATQLPNAERFALDTDAFLKRPRKAGECAAVIVFDLDRLRKMQETLGIDALQELLLQISERLRVVTRNVDRLVRVQSAADRPAALARLRGHEFALLAPSFASEAEAARFAQTLVSFVNQPFDWRDVKLSLECAAGVAVAFRDGADADTLVRHARLALSSARGQAGHVKFYAKSMANDAQAKLTMEKNLRLALDRGEIRAYFMPKVNLASGKIEGAEALARWVRPGEAAVAPAAFIPLAEETGLIGALADAVMREACWKAAGWAREGLPIQVAVNVSPMQFRDERFPDHVLRILDEAGLPAFCLELEITESIAVEDPERVLRMIEPLRQRGVRFAIDDFGCGHSSLATLTRLPFDVLKIDKEFVAGLEKDRAAPAIIETILAMAATLDMQVVAEGIEREKDAEFLRRRGCRHGQGFLYGAAMPAADFAEQVRAQRSSVLGEDQETDAA
ncbi:MAG: EAL domain-containing protein [Alphaproteobacteria bacterium]|nr:EAL domain-containing protein [Alphaproteobacteria bacterium]